MPSTRGGHSSDDPLWSGDIGYEVPPLAPGQREPPRPPGTPEEVEIRWSAPMPVIAGRADLDLDLPPGSPVLGGDCQHRLVTIGDSITQGFKSLAISETRLSWPVIVAYELGLRAAYEPGQVVDNPEFTFPTFPGPAKAPGLPLNLQSVLEDIEARLEAGPGKTVHLNEEVLTEVAVEVAHQVVEYWTRGEGSTALVPAAGYHHNLAVFGHDVRDALSRSRQWCEAAMGAQDHDHESLLNRIRDRVEGAVRDYLVTSSAGERSTIRTLWGPDPGATQVSAAQWLGADGGIETLVVALGANNALRAVTSLKPRWSDKGFDTLEGKGKYNVWSPPHFEREFGALAAEVAKINARHVIWATVPHVTVIPILRGVGDKPYYSRYFNRYTRPWITDEAFDASTDDCLTGDEARAIDSAIDQYNYFIKRLVRDARTGAGGQPRDWYLLDLCGLLDRLAYKRYLASPQSRPDWFAPYPLPPELLALSPRPDSRFFRTDVKGRLAGGLFALDGVHPTTVGYGIVAQEVITIMSTLAGVQFWRKDGTLRPGEVKVDFDRLINEDTLISKPPQLLDEDLKVIGAINKVVDIGKVLVHKL